MIGNRPTTLVVLVLLLSIFIFAFHAEAAKINRSPTQTTSETASGTANTVKARLLTSEGSPRISGLNWDPYSIELNLESTDNKTATIKGNFDRVDPVLLQVVGIKGVIRWKSATAAAPGKSGKGPFELTIALEKDTTLFQVTAVSSTGTVETEFKVLIVPRLKFLSGERKARRHIVTVSIGPSTLNYSEVYGRTLTRTLNQVSLTLKAAYNYLLAPPNWDLGINAYITALPLTSTSTGTSSANETARFVGANARLGYSIPFIKEPWKLSILAGWYYTTTIVSNNAMGYQNLMGPQIFPTIRRVLKSGDAVFAYFKYAPITSDGLFEFLGPNSREIAAGFGWVHPMKNGTPLSISFDFASLGFTIPTRVSTIDAGIVSTTGTFQNTSYSLSVGIGI